MASEHFIVVGGTSGNGRVLVRSLCAKGHSVSLIGRKRSAEVEAKLAGLRFYPVELTDVSALAGTLESIIAQGGKVNHIVFFQRYRDKGDSWLGEFQTSMTATKLIIEFCTAHFQPGGNCSIVAVSSNASRLIFAEQPLSYHTAKAALIQTVKYFAVMLGPAGVRVNAVTPDAVMKEESKPMYDKNPALKELYESITPLRRMGTPQDVANVIEFLCSPQSQFITGQEIIVDGGLSLSNHSSVARRAAKMDDMKLTR